MFEMDEILNGALRKETKHLLTLAARTLQKSGADFIVMPCNSLHVFAKEISESVTIPFLNLIECTANFLKNQKVSQVGFLSTRITRDNALYDSSLKERGIDYIFISGAEQEKLNKIILKLTFGRYTDKDKNEFTKMVLNLKTDHIVLACTDLQLIMPDISRIRIHDTMKILAQSTIREMVTI